MYNTYPKGIKRVSATRFTTTHLLVDGLLHVSIVVLPSTEHTFWLNDCLHLECQHNTGIIHCCQMYCHLQYWELHLWQRSFTCNELVCLSNYFLFITSFGLFSLPRLKSRNMSAATRYIYIFKNHGVMGWTHCCKLIDTTLNETATTDLRAPFDITVRTSAQTCYEPATQLLPHQPVNSRLQSVNSYLSQPVNRGLQPGNSRLYLCNSFIASAAKNRFQNKYIATFEKFHNILIADAARPRVISAI